MFLSIGPSDRFTKSDRDLLIASVHALRMSFEVHGALSEIGEKATDTIIHSGPVDKTVKFHDPMKKQRLHTFTSLAAKKTLTSIHKKSAQIKAESNLLGRLLMLSQQHDISLEKLFGNPLGTIPWSLATADGGLVKTDKSK